jgi:ribosomal protein S2
LVDYKIPANDDAIKAVRVITTAIAEAAAEGSKLHASKSADKAAESPQEA